MMKLVRGYFYSAAILMALIGMVPVPSVEAAGGGEAYHAERQPWSFGGLFGTFDQGQLQRGYKIYKENCASCHSMNLLHFRNLGEPGGPGFSEDQVKALAAEMEVPAGPNDDGETVDEDGEPFKRPGRPADPFPNPFSNDKAAAAANNGVAPPDLSLMAKARCVHEETAWYVAPFKWIYEIATAYQECGADYIYALLTSYKTAPDHMKMAEGMHYNAVFGQIAMPNPLSEDAVEYTDGTPQTVKQYAADVSAFLMWAAEPKLEERKIIGSRVMFYLIILSVLLFFVKKKVWSDVKH